MANTLVSGRPWGRAGTSGPAAMVRRAQAMVRDTVEYYADRRARRLMVATSILFTYGGGVVMFWFHALYRGEQGPAISDMAHWFLDSTLGFVALSPVIFFLIPAAGRLIVSMDPPRYLHMAFYALLVGASFAFVTGPGPALHNLIAGEGKPLADWATDVFGRNAAVASRALEAQPRSHATEGLLQVAIGIPVYVVLAWLAARLSAATSMLNPSR